MIGRFREIHRLDQCMRSEEAQLIAVYGRRRVGKTYLINHFFNGRFDFKVTGLFDQSKEVQLHNFITELNAQSQESHPAPTNWRDAFGMLKEYLSVRLKSDEKVVVFFDEMPWMDTQKSGFISAFEWFWNGWGSSQKSLVVIACGSAASWMKRNIDQNKGGLYNRLTARIYLNPFTLKETEQYLDEKGIIWSRYDIVECYMIMGGIPYYLSKLSPELSYTANIDNLFFRKRAELWDEYTFLYDSLFKNSLNHKRIAEALSEKRSGLTREEIKAKIRMPENGALSDMLDDMEYSGLIRINDIYGKRKKVYQLSDYYSMFYYRFLKDQYGKDEHYWTNTIDNPVRRSWAGLTFESVCKDHIEQIKRKLGISGVLSTVSVWSNNADEKNDGAQIDMLIDRRDRVINVCEIKYSIGEYEIDRDNEMKLRKKIDIFRNMTKTKSALQLTMITTYGVLSNKHSSIVANQVTMDDLFTDEPK